MPNIQPIKATDSDEAKRSKENAAIARVNELDNTAADIAAMASSANAAMRNAGIARDDARDIAADVSVEVGTAAEARDAAIAARVAAESARNAASISADNAAESEGAAEVAQVAAEAARDDAVSAKEDAEEAASAANLSAVASGEARDDAEAAALRAEAAENSLLEWKGAWEAATAYAPSDIVRSAGSAYVCLIAHTSVTFATDLGAGRWELFAQQGSPGPESGDMTASVYDPDGKETDVYSRGNHTGAQAISTVTGLQTALDGKAASGHTHPVATTSAAGLMAAADKTKLNGIADGAQVNTVTSVAGRTGDVTIGWGDVGSKPAVISAGATEADAREAIGLGDLATKDKAAAGDIDVTGTPGADNVLFGDRWGGILGVGQTWQNVKASRVFGTTYQNTTGRPIQVSISTNSANAKVQSSTNGITWVDIGYGNYYTTVQAIIPVNGYYRLGGTSSAIEYWAELR